MIRSEAEKLLNTHVLAWTASNGCYAGTLIEVIKSRPWRGKVKITGIIEIATPYEIGRVYQRKGFRIGDTIEVGGSNIKPTENMGVSRLEALQSALKNYEHFKEKLKDGRFPQKDAWWIEKGYTEISNRIQEEVLEFKKVLENV